MCLLRCLVRVVVSVYNSVAGFVYLFDALVFCVFGLVWIWFGCCTCTVFLFLSVV